MLMLVRAGGDVRRRGDVDDRSLSGRAGRQDVRLHGDPGVSRPRSRELRALARLQRLVREPRRARHDEPPLRARLRASALRSGAQLHRGRILREDAAGGARVSGLPDQLAGQHHARHQASDGRDGGRGGRGLQRQAARGLREHRERVLQRRPADPVPSGAAVPRRHLRSVPLQEVHRRAAGVRARGDDRVLRRRSRQLHVPALRRGLRVPARVRERQARDARRTTSAGAPPARRTASSCSCRAIPARPRGCSR